MFHHYPPLIDRSAGATGDHGQYPTFVFDTPWYRLGDRAFNPIIVRVIEQFARESDSWIGDFCGGDHRFGRFPLHRKFRVVNFDKSKSAIAVSKTAIRRFGLRDEAVECDLSDPSLDLGVWNLRGAISWRGPHTQPEDVRTAMMRKAFDSLAPGASFFLALLSGDEEAPSWERLALGNEFVPNVANDLKYVMRFDELRESIAPEQRHLLPEHWLFTFFTKESGARLGTDVGFEVAGDIEVFEEANAWPHLTHEHPFQRWIFVPLRKPNGCRGHDVFKPAFEASIPSGRGRRSTV